MSTAGAPAPGGPASPWRDGTSQNRFGQWQIIVVFTELFAVLAGIAVLIAVLKKPAAPQPVCPPHVVCANPPRSATPGSLQTGAPALVNEQEYIDAALGYKLEYPGSLGISDHTGSSIELASPDGSVQVLVVGAPASRASPTQMQSVIVGAVSSHIPDLASDPDPNETILAPALAGHQGVGGFYQGDLDAPQGPKSPSDVAVLASSDGTDTLGVAVISTDRSRTNRIFATVDQLILYHLRFKGDIP